MRFRQILICGVLLAGGTLIPRADAACPSCVNLVFDGDSISAGVGSSPGHGLDSQVIAGLGHDVESHNVAVGGRPVSECLRLYSKLVERLFDASMGHNLIVFHAGDNDIGQGRDAVQTYAAFTDYVTAAHRQGWKVVVSTELRRPDFDPSKQVQLDDYNNRLRRNEAAADAVVELDLDTRMPDLAIRKDAEIFSHDRIHPNDGGYAILASMLVPAVKQLVGR